MKIRKPKPPVRPPEEQVAFSRGYQGGKVRLIVRPEGVGASIVTGGTRLVHLNGTAAAIVRGLLAGQAPGTVARRLLRQYRAPPTLVRRHVAAVASLLRRLADGDRDPVRDGGSILERTRPFTHTSGVPIRADVEVGPDPIAPGNLDTVAWNAVLDALMDAGVAQVCLTGGEPLGRRDLEELAARLARRGVLVGLATGGEGLSDPARAARLAPLFDYVQFDVASLNPDSQRAWTGPGAPSLAKVRASLRTSSDAGMRAILHLPLLKANEAEVAGIIRWAHEQGCDRAALSLPEEAQEAPADLDATLRRIRAAAAAVGLPLVAHPVIRITPRIRGLLTDREGEGFGDLSIGTTEWGAARVAVRILPDGRAAPGAWFRQPIGDVRSTSWAMIWNHPVCRDIRAKRVEHRRWEQFQAADVFPWPAYPGF